VNGRRADAPSPTQLLLGAFAGTAMMFIRQTVAPTLGIEIEAMEVSASCDGDLLHLAPLGHGGSAPIRLDVAIQTCRARDELQPLFEAWEEHVREDLASAWSHRLTTTFHVRDYEID
jgi:hypothetical protein